MLHARMKGETSWVFKYQIGKKIEYLYSFLKKLYIASEKNLEILNTGYRLLSCK